MLVSQVLQGESSVGNSRSVQSRNLPQWEKDETHGSLLYVETLDQETQVG